MNYVWSALSSQFEQSVNLVCQRTKAGSIEALDSVFREAGEEKIQEEGTQRGEIKHHNSSPIS